MNVILKLFLGFNIISVLVWTKYNVNGTVARYDGYRLYKITPRTDQHLKLLNDIESTSDSFNFISRPSKIDTVVTVVVAPHKFADFDLMMSMEGITYEIAENNVQSLIDEESLIQTRISENFGWKRYYPLDSIYRWIDGILEEYPGVTSPIYAGKTYKERDIRGVKISYKNGNPGIFIEGGIHAREWISPAVTTYLLNDLLSSKNESIRSIAENFDWYIVPSVNPDGYVYTHTSNRLWRKTRKPYGWGCFGVDPNRNFDFQFGKVGVSKNPCSDLYPGPKAFSEIEMKSYGKYLASLQDKIHTFLSFHAYSQLLLFPYGHTNKKADNYDDLLDIGNKAISALARRYNTTYRVGDVYNTIYPASGCSMDWVYEVLKVQLSYTYELRPDSKSSSGFELPADKIIPTALETIDSIVSYT
ncbi:hypothetical protein HA402_001806 [Bradysia odoriphaga]|nr:hypothetical protein HA402_001806 [Bradysia odoriphaga]